MDLPPTKRAAWLHLAERDDLRLVAAMQGDLLFAVTGGPSTGSDQGTLEPSTPGP